MSIDLAKRHLQLTCGQCHFLILSRDATTAGQTVCRRHPKQVTMQLVETQPVAPKSNGIERVLFEWLQTAFLQGQPLEQDTSIACGDFRARNDGADYWTTWRRERARMIKADKGEVKTT